MDIGYIHTFHAVVRHRGFAAAAKHLGVSRSGVSLQIAALEEAFGVQLFDRSTRPPQLTFEGRTFLQRSRNLLAAWNNMKGQPDVTDPAATFVIGAVQTVVAGILPYALRRFQQRCPDVPIRLTTGIANELDALLRRNDLDVIVQPHSDNIAPGLVWQPVCTEPLMVVAPAGMAGDSDLELLTAARFIRFRRIAWGLSRMIDHEFARRGIEVNLMGEADSIDAILTLVRNGFGVTILPWRRMAEPFADGVRCLPFGDPPLSRTIGVLSRGQQSDHATVQALYQALIETAAEVEGTRPDPTATPPA